MRLPQWAAMRPIGVCRLASSFLSSQHVAECGDITRLHSDGNRSMVELVVQRNECSVHVIVFHMTTITLYVRAEK